MPDCRYCDAAFEDDEEFTGHLAAAHEWVELSRIDRKRIEVLLPEAVPQDEAEPRLDDTTDLNALLEQNPTTDVIGQALAEHDRLIRQAEQNDERSHANDLFWDYYEPLATYVDAVVTAEGWPVLADLMDVYDPQDDTNSSPATSVIGNAIGRHLIRTRLDDDVASLPEEGLAYLFALHGNEPDAGWEEAAVYSWGIGYPNPVQPISDRIHAAARDDIYWATSTLEHAFYADQHAACGCLARIARDEEVTNTRYLFSCVSAHNREYWPAAPRYWDWEENVEIVFEWDETVVSRIRDLVAEVGIERDLPDEWSLSDLAV